MAWEECGAMNKVRVLPKAARTEWWKPERARGEEYRSILQDRTKRLDERERRTSLSNKYPKFKTVVLSAY